MKPDRADGWATRLNCPECGRPVESLIPYEATNEYPHPWWEEGDSAVCDCGASLVVAADGERAWLVFLEAHD